MNRRKLAVSIYDFYRAIRRASPLTIGEYNELSILSLLHRDGQQRVTAIAEREGLTQPGATTILRRLAEQGLITQIGDKADARVTLAVITPAGIAQLESVEQARTRQLEQVIEQLSPVDEQALEAAETAMKDMTNIIRDSKGVAGDE